MQMHCAGVCQPPFLCSSLLAWSSVEHISDFCASTLSEMWTDQSLRD